MMNKKDEKVCRKLVTLCRCDAYKHPKLLQHREDGCLSADALCKVLNLKEEAYLIQIIEAQDQPRLAYKKTDDGLWIYCYQGIMDQYMSTNGGPVQREKLYSKPVIEPGFMLYHTTFLEKMPKIQEEGIHPFKRDVHLWGPENKKKGRSGGDCVLEVDAFRLVSENPDITVWLAGNGVYLINAIVPPSYFSLVTN